MHTCVQTCLCNNNEGLFRGIGCKNKRIIRQQISVQPLQTFTVCRSALKMVCFYLVVFNKVSPMVLWEHIVMWTVECQQNNNFNFVKMRSCSFILEWRQKTSVSSAMWQDWRKNPHIYILYKIDGARVCAMFSLCSDSPSRCYKRHLMPTALNVNECYKVCLETFLQDNSSK